MKKIFLDELEISQVKRMRVEEKNITFQYPIEIYVNYLEKHIDSYNFVDDFSECFYLFEIISYMMKTVEINQESKRGIYEKLKTIREKVRSLISQKPKEVDKNHPNLLLLKRIINQIEGLIVAGFYDLMDYYQGNGFQLLEYLLFEVKNYNLIVNIFKQYPYMIRFMNNSGEKLIKKVIERYIDEIYFYTSNKELKVNSHVVYYDKILTLFLNHEKLQFDIQERENIIHQIQECRKQIKSEDYNDLTKRKFIFWLNHLEEKLQYQNHEVTFKEVCYMHDIKTTFDQGILSEVRRLETDITFDKYPNRRFLSDEYIVTIDDFDAEELDDGLSIQQLENGYYRLGIHIADPTGLLSENSIILEEAFKRTTSIYLNNQTIYMFPEVLAKDKLNLLEGQPRLATSYYLYVNAEGRIESYEFLETIIKVHNITYTQADAILKTGNCNNKQLLDTLVMLSMITSKLGNNFRVDPVYQAVNRHKSNPSKTNIISSTNASKIVETCMMMANYIVPFHMKQHNLPCINRIHILDSDYLKRLSAINNNIYFDEQNSIKNVIHYLSSFYPKSKYSVDKVGHFGLGLPIYSHVTSPLRRGIDNVQKIYVLNPFYFNQVQDKVAYQIEERLKDICSYFNERSTTISYFLDNQKILSKHLS